jgi:uncharacterized protein (DUF1800 family)
LSAADATLLIRRATFGRSASGIGDLVGRSADDIVNELVTDLGSTPAAPPELSGSSAAWQKADFVRNWWYDRMAFSEAPLREKMVLFLHGHFTCEFAKLGSARQLFDQNQLFRAYAFGDLRALTHAVCLQPAMLHFLDNSSNAKEQPNENFAREVWELFLLGTGSYEQSDVVESARAWTGHTTELSVPTEPDSAKYRFVASQHDNGMKKIFGKSMAFNGPDVIDWTFDGPKRITLSRFFVTKLWRFFTGKTPSSNVRDSLAQVLRHRWNLGDVLRVLFTHQEFYATKTREPLTRSPTELIAETMRSTNLHAAELNPNWFAARMGQELFSPPTVAGWEAGAAWHSATTFYGRVLFASHAAYVAESQNGFLGETTTTESDFSVDTALRTFGVINAGDATRANIRQWLDEERAAGGWATIRHLIMLVMLSPEYQMA